MCVEKSYVKAIYLAVLLSLTLSVAFTIRVSAAVTEVAHTGNTESGEVHSMTPGWNFKNNTWYFINENGEKATGWIKDNDKWYYLKSSGAMATGWIKDGNIWYYLKDSGAMATGWLKKGSTWYYLRNSGAMATGWLKDNNKWYYLKDSGAMATGWLKDGNKWYYLKSSGAMATGWLKENNKWYYLNSSGAMVNGFQKIDGKGYSFSTSGALVGEVSCIRSYSDSTCKVDVFKKWYAGSWCYCAHIQLKDYKRFGTADAYGSYGSRETVKHAGSRLGAILCVNGDYASNSAEPHPAVRKGTVTAKGGKNVYACEAYNSNTGLLFNAFEGCKYPGTDTKCSTYTYNEAVSRKLLTDTFIFGPAALNNGVLKGSNGGNSRPRTLIGTNGNPGDIWLVVAAGDYVDGTSAGLTSYEGVSLLQELGCTFGGHLDGGGSSAMYFRGELLVQSGRDASGEGVADFVYVK